MKIFLMIVGGFLAAMALFVLLVFLWIRAKVRGFVRTLGESIKGMAECAQFVPPFRIKLEPADELQFEDPEAVETLARSLREAGFESVGRFVAETHGPLQMLALVHPQQSAYAVIYEKKPLGVWMDVVTRYTDGTAFTCSTAAPSGMRRAPGKELVNLPGVDAATLYRRFREQRPNRTALPAPPEKFVECFERYYAEEMDWHLERGGPTEEEIRAMVPRDDTPSEPEAQEQLIHLVRNVWQSQIDHELTERLRASFLAQTEISAAQWEEVRDRLVFVHDRMNAEGLMGQFWGLRDKTEENAGDSCQTARQIAERERPRTAFAQINELLPASRRFEKHGVVTEPVEADVYLTPQEPED